MEDLKSKLNVKVSDFLQGAELYVIVLDVIYTLLLVIFHAKFDNFWLLMNYNIGIVFIVLAIAYLDYYFGENKWLHCFRIVAIMPIVYLMYLNTQYYIKAINPIDYDTLLIAWDKAIFGGDPTNYFDSIRTPILTEYLQICYVAFYFLFLCHGVELYIRKKNAELNSLYNYIVFGFLFSYVLYLFLPAIGPRFSLYDFHTLNSDIPGIYFTDGLRAFINNGGGIPVGCRTPELFVNRDCMPSGHTWLTMMNIILAFRFKSKLRWFFLVVGGSLIVSTIYMRYHYGIDVLVGMFFAGVSLIIEPKIRNKFRKFGFKKV